jgi:hypothetical protein
MNLNSHNSFESSRPAFNPASTGEDTLRLIAGLPAPEGLEQRVHSALRSAPPQGRVLAWPLALRADAAWVRASAAAAIVMIVAGGGWGVYTHIQPSQAAKAPAVPAKVGSAGGFTNADAKRTSTMLAPPVVTPAPKAAAATPVQKKNRKKSAATAVQAPTSAQAAPSSK